MPEHARDYETLGYVISGKAELHLEGQFAASVSVSEPQVFPLNW